jgi:hypothetical protein
VAIRTLPLLPPREERAGERRIVGAYLRPLSQTLSPFVLHGAREKIGFSSQPLNSIAVHPDPLASDGRGNTLIRLVHLLQRLDTPTDGGRFSLSHPMGEGRAFAAPKRLRPRRRGEGDYFTKSEVVFARVLTSTD